MDCTHRHSFPNRMITVPVLAEKSRICGLFGAAPTFSSRHVAARKAAMVYFSQVPVPQVVSTPCSSRRCSSSKQKSHRPECTASFLPREQFRDDFKLHLDIEMNKPEWRWLQSPQTNPEIRPTALSDDAQSLLLAASKDTFGSILITSDNQGLHIQTAEEAFTDGTPRTEARWKSAMEKLKEQGFLETTSDYKHAITHAGFAEADRIETRRKTEEEQTRLSDRALGLLRAMGVAAGRAHIF